jgi:hypothetical protein
MHMGGSGFSHPMRDHQRGSDFGREQGSFEEKPLLS